MYTLSESVDTLDSSVVFERIDAHTLIGGPLRGLLAIPIPLYGKVCKYSVKHVQCFIKSQMCFIPQV